MNFFAFIMAILVLTQSLMPCADEGIVTEGKVKTELSKVDQHNDESEPDDCSPFCQCTCCAGFSISHLITFISPLPLHKDKTLTISLSLDILDVALPIWQPPQIV